MKSVRDAIARTVGEIEKAPFCFHTEADVRAMIYKNLRYEFPDLYQTALGQPTWLVHCEYFGRRRSERIDLVVLSPADVQNINLHPLRVRSPDKPGYRPASLSAAIEIKANIGGRGDRMTEYVQGDLEKLEEHRKGQPAPGVDLSYVYIVRWPTTDARARKRESDRVTEIQNMCKSRTIEFFANKPDTWFPEAQAF